MATDVTNNKQTASTWRYKLQNRYVFEGKLEMRTGLHIGGGKATLSYTDSPVVLTPEGLPFIPGSSFKGTLRSTIEKLTASLNTTLLHTCGLPVKETPEESCPTAHQQQIVDERRKRSDKAAEAYLERQREQLCHTCQLFGSPYAAARITVNDLYLINDEWSGVTQIRDGVAIDRDSETAKHGAKYDFEVVPSTTVFNLRIVIENATEQDLQLISMGLSEFVHGFGGVGGLRSRGLGACVLNDLQIRYVELNDTDKKRLSETERRKRLQRYLLRKRDGQEQRDDGLETVEDTQQFFEKHINALFESIEKQEQQQ